MKVLLALMVTLFLNINGTGYSYNTIDVSEVQSVMTPNVGSRIERLLEDTSGTISEEVKNKLVTLEQKIKNYEVITQEELEFIRNCELDIIRSKLGDAQFEEYCKLIEKREGNGEFLPPERYRLYELEKQLNNIR